MNSSFRLSVEMTMSDEKSQKKQYRFKANFRRNNFNRNNSFRFDTIEALTNRINELKKERRKKNERKNREYSILISTNQKRRSDIKTSSTKEKKNRVKTQSLSIFQSNDDVKLWIMKVQDFFYLQNINDSTLQTIYVISYFNDTLKKRTQRLKLAENTKSFSSWINLQKWLKDNYERTSVKLNAELAIKTINMKYNKRIQNFINKFEIIVAELNWNESTICFSFKKKLTSNLLNVIHFLHSKKWFEIFVKFKKLAHETENHIKIDNKMQEKKDEQEFSTKRVRFFENRKSFFRQISNNQKVETQKQKKNINKKWIFQ